MIPDTALIAAPLALLIAGLGLSISLRRVRGKFGVGREGDADFVRLVRAHGNAVEHVPLVLVLLALFEASTREKHAALLVGGVFVLGRVMHAWGVIGRHHRTHKTAAGLTYAIEVFLGVTLLVLALR